MTRVPPPVALAAHLGRGFRRVGATAVLGRRQRLPRTPADLTPAVLSGLLGREVSTVSVIDGDAGTSSRAKLALTGNGVPASVFVKLPAETAATRLMGELGRLADTEVRFYQQLAAEVPGVPACYASTFDPRTGGYVLVLEDLTVDACEFPDTLHPLSSEQAGQVVELLAGVHATFWDRLPAEEGRGPLGWIYSTSGDCTSLLTGSLLKTSSKRVAERSDIPVANGKFIDENYRAVATVMDRPPHTVLHGDAHPGNVYFRNGKAGLLDWQAVRRGHPSRELAYTLITAMRTEDRRTHQHDLLDRYRDALAAAGGPVLGREDLWTRYRQAALYGYIAPLITAGMGGMQEDGIAMEGARRGVAALEDLETVTALKEAL